VEFEEVVLYLLPLLFVIIVGCSVLVYQCNRLIGILRRKRAAGKRRSEDKDAVDKEVEEMQNLQGHVRASAQKTQEQLAQEVQTIAEMQVGLTAQLNALKSVLAHIDDSKPKGAVDGEESLVVDDTATTKKEK
jgi:Tfp pilus assembly protein PilN